MSTTKYYANPVGANGTELKARVEQLMRDGVLGFIDTPKQSERHTRYEGLPYWCADNGCFGKNFNEDEWWAWLSDQAQTHEAGTCEFATAPDVVHNTDHGPVGDAAATLERSRPWLPKIRALGLPVAYVAQDGFDPTVVPWDDFDVLFIGGSDDFKVGPMGIRSDGTPKGEVPAQLAIKEALARGKKVHIGRVNSQKRLRFAQKMGATSADGTWLTFGPDKNLPKLLSVVEELRQANSETSEHDIVAAAAADSGWERRDAQTVTPDSPAGGWPSHGWVRGDQVIHIMVSPTGRILHATFSTDPEHHESQAAAKPSPAGQPPANGSVLEFVLRNLR